MRIVVTANGKGLDAPVSTIFGRCLSYVLVDTETMDCETVDNPALAAAGGAGIQAAQFIVGRGAQALVTGNVGPNAYGVLQAAGIPVHTCGTGTVRQAVEAYKTGKLPSVDGATVPEHAGGGHRRRTGQRGTA